MMPQDPSVFGIPVDLVLSFVTLTGIAIVHQCTMLPRPFKDLEWHRGKKHRHHRLSLLLLRGLLATTQSQSLRLKKTQRVSAVVKTTLAQRQKLLRASFQS
jgi:hypothetical protein